MTGGARCEVDGEAGIDDSTPETVDPLEVRGLQQPRGAGKPSAFSGSFRESGACGPWRDDAPGPCGHRPWPCGRGSRGCARADLAGLIGAFRCHVSTLDKRAGAFPKRAGRVRARGEAVNIVADLSTGRGYTRCPFFRSRAQPTMSAQPFSSTLWTLCLAVLEDELPEQQFNTWIRPLQAVEEPGRPAPDGPEPVRGRVGQQQAVRPAERDPARGRPGRAGHVHGGGGPRPVAVAVPSPAAADSPAGGPGAAGGTREQEGRIGHRPAPEPRLHLRRLRRGQEQPLREGRRVAGGREPGPGLQPAVHLRRRRSRARRT